jgi:hypothetical protein
VEGFCHVQLELQRLKHFDGQDGDAIFDLFAVSNGWSK